MSGALRAAPNRESGSKPRSVRYLSWRARNHCGSEAEKGWKHTKIPQSVRELLAKGPLGHLTTLNKDGSPQVTVVWVGVENEEFVLGHLVLRPANKFSLLSHFGRASAREIVDAI